MTKGIIHGGVRGGVDKISINGRHNNSFNRSEISLAFIVNLSHDAVASRPVNSGVMPLSWY
jgi:hypothetical protein